MNVGEELVASYLRTIKGCDFTQTNLYPPGVQGEIDVIGVNLKEKIIYVCEVAIHLRSGLRYVDVKKGRPNNVVKLTEKFTRDINYAQKSFPGYERHFMLWSPIVKGGKANAMYNQLNDLEEIKANLQKKYDVAVEFVVNKDFLARINDLREYAASRTEELKCPVLRLLQIEALLLRHLKPRNHAFTLEPSSEEAP